MEHHNRSIHTMISPALESPAMHSIFAARMIRHISIEDFLDREKPLPLADVRTPAEFAKGHIPGAVNLPLFSNEERIQVGTTYKQAGREAAILLGFDLTGPKWSGYIREALGIAPAGEIAVHCWRGGMRSSAMAWALDLYGFEVSVILGGYKSYRQWAHRQFARPFRLRMLGGGTGSGKTKMLQKLQAAGGQVIDLESLAQHCGSSYGSLNKLVQPTQEQFENNFAQQLCMLHTARPVWVEDESLKIGRCAIPYPFWLRMREAPLWNLQVDTEQRIAALVTEYGSLDADFLVACTERIRKRLGPEQTQQAVAAIREGRMEDFIRIVLVYYDKAYRTGLRDRDPASIFAIPISGDDPETIIAQLLAVADTCSVKQNSPDGND